MENAGPILHGVEKVGPPTMEREMDRLNVWYTDKKTLQSSEETVD